MVQCLSHWQSLGSEMLLGFADRMFSKVEDARGQHGIGFSVAQDIGEVLQFAGAAACYNGNSYRF